MQSKIRLLSSVVLVMLLWSVGGVSAERRATPQAVLAPVGTGFTYQGLLKDTSGQPVTNRCDFQFTLWDSLSGGNALGTVSEALGVGISQGYFTAQVNAGGEFGASAFTGQARWLAISVRCPAGSGGYAALTPRQGLTPTPYALALPGLYTQMVTDSVNIIGGYTGNGVSAGMVGATISGGGTTSSPNRVTGDYGTVSGGVSNTVSFISTVGGGSENTASGAISTVGGGAGNTASGMIATVSGGGGNTAGGYYASVGGGLFNTIKADYATVGGGQYISVTGEAAAVAGGSWITATGSYAVVGGGRRNTASGYAATVSGGNNNAASSEYTVVSGGSANVASGLGATVGGGIGNTAAGDFSFVVGRQAANTNSAHGGVFLFADATGPSFPSTATNQFRARATGGVQFVTGIDGDGNPTAGVEVVAGGGSWSSLSDRNLKANFIPVDGQAVLAKVAALPLSTWNYMAQDVAIRHIGPMAQDFYAAFGVGEDDTHITTIDADGVALAAIQGLNEVVAEKDARIAALEAESAMLKAQSAELEARVQALEQNAGSGGAAIPLATPWPWLALVVVSGMVLLRRKAGG